MHCEQLYAPVLHSVVGFLLTRLLCVFREVYFSCIYKIYSNIVLIFNIYIQYP